LEKKITKVCFSGKSNYRASIVKKITIELLFSDSLEYVFDSNEVDSSI